MRSQSWKLGIPTDEQKKRFTRKFDSINRRKESTNITITTRDRKLGKNSSWIKCKYALLDFHNQNNDELERILEELEDNYPELSEREVNTSI